MLVGGEFHSLGSVIIIPNFILFMHFLAYEDYIGGKAGTFGYYKSVI